MYYRISENVEKVFFRTLNPSFMRGVEEFLFALTSVTLLYIGFKLLIRLSGLKLCHLLHDIEHLLCVQFRRGVERLLLYRGETLLRGIGRHIHGLPFFCGLLLLGCIL